MLKLAILALFAIILLTLLRGLFLLLGRRDRPDRARALARTLTLRVVLTAGLLLILLISVFSGLLVPHGISP
ncbi:DUF2909 family protein [Granulosicoccaceae sp. 1_MG-2023]|nr:DUF2909 family protein [Granulosicoccaceae sp. 1_MG-2023]